MTEISLQACGFPASPASLGAGRDGRRGYQTGTGAFTSGSDEPLGVGPLAAVLLGVEVPVDVEGEARPVPGLPGDVERVAPLGQE